jgi:ABC-type transport system involved in multi-copper enzyme maturation permease subunit
MPTQWFEIFVVLLALLLVQGLAALPYLCALDQRLRGQLGTPAFWLKGAAACAAIAAVGGFALASNGDPKVLSRWGRFLFSLLHLQLAVDGLVIFIWLLLKVWPKGAAIAYSAFRETLRQPMFLALLFAGMFLMGITPFIPYFTFGEDQKMVKEICFAWLMMAPAFLGVLTASISVSEEIEGRTAITLMSKPVSRRQFLLGKFVGILLGCLAMTLLLGWWLIWVVLLDPFPLPGVQPTPDAPWAIQLGRDLFDTGAAGDLVRGMALWANDALVALPGLIIGFGQVMILIAVAVALATRLPMILSITVCFMVYVLGHLTAILTEVSKSGLKLVYFVAQLFDTLAPGLNLFDVGSAIVRDVPLEMQSFFWYALNVTFYACVYSAIALLFGLVLFEDRDLA